MHETHEHEIHDMRRQSLLFDTGLLKSAKVAVFGSGPVSNFLCAYLSGLGIGQIVLVDNDIRRRANVNEAFSELCRKIDPKVNNISKTVRKINHEISIVPYFSIPNRLFIESCSVVIDSTNDPESKYKAFRYCRDSEKLLISCSSTRTCASISIHDSTRSVRSAPGKSLENITLSEFEDLGQGSFTSGLIAAVAADEIRKRVCRIDSDKPLDKRLNYSILSPERFFPGRIPRKYFGRSKRTSKSMDRAKGKKALVVGAGGIGTYVLLNLAMIGCDIDLYDGDVVESHNLNRQIIHFEGVNQNKAEKAAKEIGRVNPKIRVRAFPEYITDSILKQKMRQGVVYDTVFSCVDSWKARHMLNSYCRVTETPLFNGGVTTFRCVVDYFIPGKMHCLECSNNYRKRMKEERRPVSCGELEANVVMPNAVAGALMVAEAMQVFSPVVPPLHDKGIVYNSKAGSQKKFILEKINVQCGNKMNYQYGCRCHPYLEV